MTQRWVTDFLSKELTIIAVGLTLTYAPLQREASRPYEHRVVIDNRPVYLSRTHADVMRDAYKRFQALNTGHEA